MAEQEGIRVIGLRDLQRSLKQLSDSGEWGKELRLTNKSAAESVASRASQLAPVKTGRLAASIRALASQRSGSVAGGGARVPYFGFIDFGGTIRFKKSSRQIKRPYLSGGRIIYKALGERREQVLEGYEDAVTDLIKRSGLKEQ